VDIRLTIVGSGDMLERIAAFARDNGLDDAFRLLGRLGDPFPEVGRADLMIVPSLFDSYPDTILEALHAGTPVIGTRVGGIPDILQHHELLFEPGSVEALCDKIRALYRDPERYRRARELCRARRERFLFDWAGEFERVMLAGRATASRDSEKPGAP
jgi:glycosyltransferase involved in cell wall biosynthesis